MALVAALAPHLFTKDESQTVGPFTLSDKATSIKVSVSRDAWPVWVSPENNNEVVRVGIEYLDKGFWRRLGGFGAEGGVKIVDGVLRTANYMRLPVPKGTDRQIRVRVQALFPIVTSLTIENSVDIGTAATDPQFGFGTSFDVTVDTGVVANRLLIAAVKMAQNGVVTAITYNAIDMDNISTVGSGPKVGLYKKVNPTSGSNTLACTLNTSTDTVLSGVPFSSASAALEARAGTTATGTTSPVTLTVTNSATGEKIVDAFALNHSSGGSTTTVGAGQTAQVDRENYDGSHSAGMSTEAGGASVVMDWTATNVSSWSQAATSVYETATDAFRKGDSNSLLGW